MSQKHGEGRGVAVMAQTGRCGKVPARYGYRVRHVMS